MLEEKPWLTDKKGLPSFVSVAARMKEKGHGFVTVSSCYCKVNDLVRRKFKLLQADSPASVSLVPAADAATHNDNCIELLRELGPFIERHDGKHLTNVAKDEHCAKMELPPRRVCAPVLPEVGCLLDCW